MKNKTTKTFFLTGLLALSLALAPSVNAAFYRDLSLGASGGDVYELQKLLNEDYRTKIAFTGPGSPGYETNYFGELTRRAVAKFQELYRNDILAPAGLVAGNGYFGSLTRSKLLALQASARPYSGLSAPSATEQKMPEKLPTEEALAGAHPNNLEGLDLYVNLHKDLARKEGWSDEQISESVNSIYRAVATSTDLKAEFARRYREAEPLSAENVLSKVGLKLLKTGSLAINQEKYEEYSVFEKATPFPLASLMPAEDHPLAAIPGLTLDFGGRLYGAWPCTCGFVVWQLVVVGLSGSSPYNLLDYVIGTQMKSTYTLPYVGQVVGQYIPAAASVACWHIAYPCGGPYPSMGIIYPAETGSSPPGS